MKNHDYPYAQTGEYTICSIYYDMLNSPLNIDIKKVIGKIMTENTERRTIYIIRVLKSKGLLEKIYGNILMENDFKPNFTVGG